MLALLRTNTQPIHHDLENQLRGFAGIDSVAKYGALLRRYLDLYEGLSVCLAATGPLVDWPHDGDERRGWLREDLTVLGGAGPTDGAVSMASAGSGTAVDGRFAPFTSRAEVVGCLYVIEGSALGGVRLARGFTEQLGVTPERGARFFTGRGPETAARWKAFCAWMEAQAWSAADEAAASARAVTTFRWFGEHLAVPTEAGVSS